MNWIKYLSYWLWQLSWGFCQSLLGLLLFLKNRHCPHAFYHGAVLTKWHGLGGVSLGPFIFAADENNPKLRDKSRAERMCAHEFAHTVQSLLLGPAYLFVIGLPSFLWCNLPYFRKLRLEKQIPYGAFYTEKWADHIAEKLFGQKLG